ncbi:MAG: carbohydrate ABC transporter permease [Gammaproteobacteria bacterium]
MIAFKPSRLWLLALCLLWLGITLFPIYWTLVTAFKPPTAVNGGPTYIPWYDFQPTWQAFADALSGDRGDFYGHFLHSTLISLTATAIAVILGSMAAYALVRFEFRVRLLAGLWFAAVAIGGYWVFNKTYGYSEVQALGLAFAAALAGALVVNLIPVGPRLGNHDIAFWFVSQRMMPPIVSAIALYLFYSRLGKEGLPALDTFWGLTFCYIAFALPFVVWLMRDFFQALPVEVEEAALVDDVPRLRIFWDIVLPMARPGLIATFLITLSFIWNEFLFALILTTGRWTTLPILIAGQNSYRGDEWWAISVAVLVAIVPMMILAAFLARLMRSGLALGSIK